MTDFVVTENNTTQQIVANGTGYIKEGATLSAANRDAIITSMKSNININGTVNAEQTTASSPAYAIKLDNVVLELSIAKSGTLASSGQFTQGPIGGTIIGDSKITNDGLIKSAPQGNLTIYDVTGASTLRFYNSGDIQLNGALNYYTEIGKLIVNNTGSFAAIVLNTSNANSNNPDLSIINHSTMKGITLQKPDNSSAILEVFNYGTISGDIISDPGKIATDLQKVGDVIVNTGTIEGKISLGNSSDLFDGRGGTISGSVEGHYGNDILIGGDGNDVLRGQGDDDHLVGGKGNATFLMAEMALIQSVLTVSSAGTDLRAMKTAASVLAATYLAMIS